MSTMRKSPVREVIEPIIIERRETIGVVQSDNWGKPIFEAIFEVIAKYFSDNLDHRMMRLEFTLDGRKFVVGTEDEETKELTQE
jgi:hypothetical protein